MNDDGPVFGFDGHSGLCLEQLRLTKLALNGIYVVRTILNEHAPHAFVAQGFTTPVGEIEFITDRLSGSGSDDVVIPELTYAPTSTSSKKLLDDLCFADNLQCMPTLKPDELRQRVVDDLIYNPPTSCLEIHNSKWPWYCAQMRSRVPMVEKRRSWQCPQCTTVQSSY